MKFNRVIKSLMAVVGVVAAMSTAHAADMTGAGATFPYPIYAKWAEMYKAKTGNGLNYQSIGSGGGIKQIKANTVDFGASDMPLTAEDLNAAGLTQFPTVMGGVVPVVNVDGVAAGHLKLDGNVLAQIYLGKVTKWNAPEIVALNPATKLPAEDIVVVHRADGSGTTFMFTDYLSKVSADFKASVGASTAVKWPVGLGGKGNEGVASSVKQFKNSIGYVEYIYAKNNNMTYTLMKNLDGQFVAPEDASFKAAAANADWAKAPNFYLVLTNQPGKASWPITGATFILMHKVQADAAKAKEVLKFFDWAYANGDAAAAQLVYIPLPDSLVKQIRESWKANIKDASGKSVW